MNKVILRLFTVFFGGVTSISPLLITNYSAEAKLKRQSTDSPIIKSKYFRNKQNNNILDSIPPIFRKAPKKPPNQGGGICLGLPNSVYGSDTSYTKPLLAWFVEEEVTKIEIQAIRTKEIIFQLTNDNERNNTILKRGYIASNDYPENLNLKEDFYYLIITIKDQSPEKKSFRILGDLPQNSSNISVDIEQLLDDDKTWDAYNLAFSIITNSSADTENFRTELLSELEHRSCQ